MTTLNVIRTLTIKSTTEGIPESTAALKNLQTAHENVAKVTETSAKHQLSMEKALAQNERRFNSSLRAQQDFEKVQKQLNLAVAQNPALQLRANDVLRRAAEHYGRALTAQTLWSRGMQAANDNAQMFAARLGPIGGALSALGPAGLTAAAGLGAAALGAHKLVTEVNALADRAGKMVDFAETTGLTTTQLQALQKAAAFVGIDVDKVGQGFERFSVQLEELRRGSGELFNALNRIDPALTDQIAGTRDAGQAWDIFARALARADRELANVAAKAAFGRTGIPFTRLAGATNEAGGIAALEQGLGRVNTLTVEQLKRWDELKDRIDFTSKTARDNLVSIYADDVLAGQLKFYEALLLVSQTAKTFQLAPDLKTLITFLASPVSGVAAYVIGQGTRAAFGGGSSTPSASPSAPAAATFAERFGAFSGNVTTKPEFDAARLRQRIEILGSAASATMKLALAEAELAIRARAAGVSQEDLARGIAALRLDNVIALEQRRIALLGEMASVDSIVIAKQREINLARMQGITITNEEARAILERTRIQAEAAKLESQLSFERSQMFRSPTDARIAETLRAQGISAGGARGQNVAEMIRFNEQMRIAIDLSTEFASGFVRDMRQGATALQALTNAVNRLADRLIDIAIKGLVQQAFGSLLGAGGGGGGLSNLLNFGSLAGSGVGGSGFPAAVGHSGGVIGQSAFPKRHVHPAYFDDAPRMHGGGMIDWAAGERPFIGQVGETIIPRGGSGGGTNVIVNVNNQSGGPVEQSETQGADGSRIIDIVIGKVKDNYAKGGFDGINRSRYGVQPTGGRL